MPFFVQICLVNVETFFNLKIWNLITKRFYDIGVFSKKMYLYVPKYFFQKIFLEKNQKNKNDEK